MKVTLKKNMIYRDQLDKCRKGDVLYGKRRSDAIHPIIFWEDHSQEFFIGIMLTSKGRYKKNIPLKPEFIRVNSSDGKKFEFQYDNTHIVRAKLLKRKDWEPFRKIGEINEDGLEHIEMALSKEENEVVWEDFDNN